MEKAITMKVIVVGSSQTVSYLAVVPLV